MDESTFRKVKQMNRQDAEKIITEYIKPTFGFALKRCRSIQDAEDLSQEIVLKAFRILLLKDDIGDINHYIWTVAHNALSNYYRDSARYTDIVPMESLTEFPGEADVSLYDASEAADSRLQSEIAYLSKLQRRIVIAYYFENRKQTDIAKELNIPLGTVKWHLFEAKKELKRGVTMTRNYGELRFNPVRLIRISCSGSPGAKGNNANFLRSALSQNIVYAVRNSLKSLSEIADELGVSPVYVESEAEFLEEYGFLLKKRDKFISNVIIEEADAEIVRLYDEMYDNAAKLFADELFDTLTGSGLLKDERIWGGQYGLAAETGAPQKDENFLLWSLIPYVTAKSGAHLYRETVPFEEAATLRPDGGHNICTAAVFDPKAPKVKYDDSLEQFYGCCHTAYENLTLWQCDSEWSDRRIGEDYAATVIRDLMLLRQWLNGMELSDSEYTMLAEMGYVTVLRENGCKKTVPQAVILKNPEIASELLIVGGKIKEKHWDALCRLRERFVRATLDRTPSHLHKARIFEMQHIFFSDGSFILYVMKHLTENGKLKLPTPEQKKMLMTVIAIAD